ncbi:MAG: glutaredoxin domain-containing protein [Burkholderiaceae bacterium]
MRVGLYWLAAAVWLFALPVAAQYRWVDGDGRVNYGDQPPGDAQNLTRIDARGQVREDTVSSLPFELRRAMSQHPVTLYTAEKCPGCEAGRVFLRRRGVPFQEIVVDTDEEAAEMKRRVGTDAVPVLALGRSPTLGFNEAAWMSALNAATYPAESQLPLTYRHAEPKSLLPRTAGPVSQTTPQNSTR